MGRTVGRAPAIGTARWDSTRRKGLAWAGGYVGDGVTAANLAGRTLADLLTDDATQTLTACRGWTTAARHWEVEPLRWLGINAHGSAYRSVPIATRTALARPTLARGSLSGYHAGSRSAGIVVVVAPGADGRGVGNDSARVRVQPGVEELGQVLAAHLSRPAR